MIAAPIPSHARLLAFLQAKHEARTARVATVGHPIARGETFINILERYGVSNADVQSIYAAAKPDFDLRRLVLGRVLRLGFSAEQRLISLRYDVDDEKQLVVQRAGRSFTARMESFAYDVRVVGAGGAIDTSFYADARRSGVPDPIISQVVDLLAWEVDFSSDVHPGDRFRVVYEQRIGYGGRGARPGRVLAADFHGRAGTASAFLYESGHGEATYLDAEGHELDGGLLRYPLEFIRISSAFSQSRFHPILKRSRPHLGVDFAAPTGTPVRAVGNGSVRWAAMQGGFGRHVELDHGGGLVSAYSHLRAIHPALRVGSHVRRGQVIGWVGQSGLATGPHLHFAIFDRGRYVNPLKFHGATQLTKIDRREFERVRASLSQRLLILAEPGQSAPSGPTLVLSSLTQTQWLGPVTFAL
jgi:murein DD-endopeptidase MepM/ murein hydrolase activator NlpD